jgi:hypothetical protein
MIDKFQYSRDTTIWHGWNLVNQGPHQLAQHPRQEIAIAQKLSSEERR